jgi:outer membrane protein OmpA-like peptidoglycan-associated protein
MKTPPAVLLLAALCACARGSAPILLDDDHRVRRPSAAEAEQTANEALRDIEDRIEKGDLPKIQFDFDKDTITPESDETLDLIAKLLLADERLELTIFAHTDGIGTDEYNLDLSRRRAESVGAYLASKGIPPPSMRGRRYGASRPVSDNVTDEGRARNRRVEFFVTARRRASIF